MNSLSCLVLDIATTSSMWYDVWEVNVLTPRNNQLINALQGRVTEEQNGGALLAFLFKCLDRRLLVIQPLRDSRRFRQGLWWGTRSPAWFFYCVHVHC